MLRSGLTLVAAGVGLGVALSRLSPDRTGELAVSQWLARHRRPSLTRGALVIDALFNAPWSVVVPAIGALAVVPQAGWAGGVRVGAQTTAGWYASHLAKRVFRRPRPTGVAAMLDLTLPDSFPSGHTALATALVTALVVSTTDRSPAPVGVVLGAALVVATGASRVYLGAHHIGDVVAAPLIAGGTVLVLEELGKH